MEKVRRSRGRPAGKNLQQISVAFPPFVIEAVERYANARGISRSAAFSELMVQSVPVINNSAEMLEQAARTSELAAQRMRNVLSNALHASIPNQCELDLKTASRSKSAKIEM